MLHGRKAPQKSRGTVAKNPLASKKVAKKKATAAASLGPSCGLPAPRPTEPIPVAGTRETGAVECKSTVGSVRHQRS